VGPTDVVLLGILYAIAWTTARIAGWSPEKAPGRGGRRQGGESSENPARLH